MGKSTTQYLTSYAEPESRQLQNFPELHFDHTLVIPCFRETPAFAERLDQSLLPQQKILTIVVINQPPGPADQLNQNLLEFFYRREILWQNTNMQLCRAAQGDSCWLVVDRFTQNRCIDPKQGVGLARKIGCDLAAQLIEQGACCSDWIYISDADAHLPPHYFSVFSASDNSSAAVFATCHINVDNLDSKVLAVTKLYEQALEYYVRGLIWAGSPYGFPTIGSAMAVRAQAYCQARGFPKRPGGEDFYLLNKLAKLGHIKKVDAICVEIEARVSDRVPFGTGPAVRKILQLNNAEGFTYYAPEVFAALKIWLSRIPHIWPALQSGTDPLTELPAEIVATLEEAGISILWQHLSRQVSTPQHCETAVHHWFDAFRTLKFIRYLQQNHFPAAPLLQSMRTAEFMENTFL